jgi:uncharacterized membrane protein YdjX (TVP38/TMEM64 family)
MHWVAYFRDWGPLPFFVAMAVLPAIGFPLAPFFVAVGLVFGPTLGIGNVIVCSIVSVGVNVALCYGIAASALRPFVARFVKWLGRELPVMKTGNAYEIVFLVRILPGLPFFLQSYLLGLARAPFIPYMIVSTVVPTVFLTSMILFGDGIWSGNRWGIAAGCVLILVASVVAHRARKRLAAARSGEN